MIREIRQSLVFDWFRNIDGDRAILRRNVEWTFHYLSGSAIFGNDLPQLLAFIDRAGPILEASGLQDNHYAWAHVFEDLSQWDRLKEFFLESCKHEIVVGFELSRGQRSLLTEAGRVYIDLRTHPLRFLPDYMFAAATNSLELHERILQITPSQSYIYRYVGFCRARAARRHSDRPINRNALVFFAQTDIDSSRIRDGEIVGDLLIVSALERIIRNSQFEDFLFKHHPHEKIPPGMLALLMEMGATETNANTYDLLSTDGLHCVSLSSSVCHEAKYFDVSSTMLLSESERFANVGEDAALGEYLMLPTNFFCREFWTYILDGGPAPAPIYPEFCTPYSTASGLRWG